MKYRVGTTPGAVSSTTAAARHPSGGFLLKRVTAELDANVESLTTFSTLSPVPGFVAWVTNTGGGLDHQLREQVLGKAGPIDSGAQDAIERCGARYLVHAN